MEPPAITRVAEKMANNPVESPSGYITMGSINMNKQPIAGLSFIQYLAHQAKHFRLTPTGEILGMEVFKHNARMYHKKYSEPGEDYNNDDPNTGQVVNDTNEAIPAENVNNIAA